MMRPWPARHRDGLRWYACLIGCTEPGVPASCRIGAIMSSRNADRKADDPTCSANFVFVETMKCTPRSSPVASSFDTDNPPTSTSSNTDLNVYPSDIDVKLSTNTY